MGTKKLQGYLKDSYQALKRNKKEDASRILSYAQSEISEILQKNQSTDKEKAKNLGYFGVYAKTILEHPILSEWGFAKSIAEQGLDYSITNLNKIKGYEKLKSQIESVAKDYAKKEIERFMPKDIFINQDEIGNLLEEIAKEDAIEIKPVGKILNLTQEYEDPIEVPLSSVLDKNSPIVPAYHEALEEYRQNPTQTNKEIVLTLKGFYSKKDQTSIEGLLNIIHSEASKNKIELSEYNPKQTNQISEKKQGMFNNIGKSLDFATKYLQVKEQNKRKLNTKKIQELTRAKNKLKLEENLVSTYLSNISEDQASVLREKMEEPKKSNFKEELKKYNHLEKTTEEIRNQDTTMNFLQWNKNAIRIANSAATDFYTLPNRKLSEIPKIFTEDIPGVIGKGLMWGVTFPLALIGNSGANIIKLYTQRNKNKQLKKDQANKLREHFA